MKHPVLAQYMGTELESILGLKMIRRAVFTFDMDRPVTAVVEFMLNKEQAMSVLTLCTDKTWEAKDDE